MRTLLLSISGIYMITATVTHIWTVIIAFTNGGFFAGIISFFLPLLSEIYWMFDMFGENNAYAWTALIHLILAIPIAAVRNW